MQVWAIVNGLPTLLLYQFKSEQGAASVGLKKSKLQDDYEVVEAAVAR